MSNLIEPLETRRLFAGLSISINGETPDPIDLKILPDGSTLIAAQFDASSKRTNSDFGVIKLTPAGLIDRSFGINGAAFIDVGELIDDPGADDFIGAVNFDSLGRILVAGDSFPAPSSFNTNPSGVLLRLSSTGQLDTSFGVGGIAKLPAEALPLPTTGFSDVIIEPTTGNYLVGGSAESDLLRQGLLAKFDQAGSLVGSFGSNGIATVDAASFERIAFDATSQAIVAVGKNAFGDFFSNAAVFKFLQSGAVDNSFGQSGRRIINPRQAEFSAISDLQVSAGGVITVVGSINPQVGDFFGTEQDDALVARLLPNGELDASFSSDGFNTISLAGFSVAGFDITVLSSGSSIIAGYRTIPTTDIDEFFDRAEPLLARITSGGSLDTTFGQQGILLIDSLLKTASVTAAAEGDDLGEFQKTATVKIEQTPGGAIRVIALTGKGAATVEISAAVINAVVAADFAVGTVIKSAKAEYLGGTKLTLQVQISNIGTAAGAATLTASILLSSDAVPDASDRTLASKSIKLSLKPGKSKSQSFSITLPTDLATADYFAIGQLTGTPAAGDNAVANDFAAASPFRLNRPFVDFAVANARFPKPPVAGKKTTATADITNLGNSKPKVPGQLRLLASTDAVLSGDDSLLFSTNTSLSLAPGARKSIKVSGTIPAALAGQPLFFFVVFVPSSANAESSAGNNSAATSLVTP